MTISVNPLTQESYQVPDTIDDKKAIKAFLSKHKGKKVIVVQST